MSDIIDFINSNYLSIVLIILFTLGLLVIINLKGWDLNVTKPNSILKQEVVVETFNEKNMQDSPENIEKIKLEPAESFCDSYLGNSSDLEKACNELTESNCGLTRCCVFTSTGKCVAGNLFGPTYKTDKDGKMITMDAYYYQNKCYGSCPT